MNNLIAAIDLGTTKTVVTVGRKTNLGIKIEAYAEVPSKGVKRGRIENVRLANQSLSYALKKVEEQLGMRVKTAFVGIAGQDIKCLSPESYQVQRPNPEKLITQEEIVKMTNDSYNFAVEDGYKIFYSVPQSYNVDNYMSVSEPVGMLGRNVVAKYKQFASKENSLRMIDSTLGLSGIKPIDVVLEPIASAKAVLTDDEMEVGSIMIDIGGGTTDVIVYNNNIIRYAGIIPFGGNSVTEDICTGCGITYDKAEYIKTHHGCCFSDYASPSQKIVIPTMSAKSGKEVHIKVLSKIIQARMEEILEAALWHVEQSGYKDAIRSGVVLTGGGSKIDNITNLANFVTGFEARIGTPKSFALDPESQQEALGATSSTAVGLLIHAFHKIEQEGFMCPDCLENIVPEVTVEQESNNPSFGGEFEKVSTEAGRGRDAEKKKNGFKKFIAGMKKTGRGILDGGGLFDIKNTTNDV